GSGGGGRITIYYDILSLPVANVIASGGKSAYFTTYDNRYPQYNGGAGTAYLKNKAAQYGDLIINNNGISTYSTTTIASGTYANLTVKGGAIIAMNGNITTTQQNLVLDNIQLTVSGTLTTPGNLTLNSSQIIVSSAMTIPGSLTLTKSGLTVTDSLTVANAITLNDNSVLSHTGTTTTTQSRLDIQATTITIDATSKIDVTGKGYLGGWQDGNSATYAGRTNGNTTTGGSIHSNGGSYGGLGGSSPWHGSGMNAVYGDLTNPAELGSGGAGTYYSSYEKGGNGGGLVRIGATTLTLDGKIIADGAGIGNNQQAGSGSGGGIRIEVGALTGTGAISAKGGDGYYYGSGGGGRIAIYYDSLSLPTTNIIASGGKSTQYTNQYPQYNGGAGTVYLKNKTVQYGDLIIDNRNIGVWDYSTPLRSLGLGVITDITANSLTNSNSLWIPGSLRGHKVNPNMNQDKIFTIVDNDAATLYIDDQAEGDLRLAAAIGDMYTGIYPLNSLNIMGKARVSSLDPFVMNAGVIIDGSTLVANNIKADNISITNSGLLSHWDATTTSGYKLELNAASSLTIDAASKIDATGKGYLGGWQGGNNSSTGRTLGNTATGGSTYYNGGSYGGLGGIYSGGSVNAVYGDLTNPAELGSGGGGHPNASWVYGGNGGGLVRIGVGKLSLDGKIIADGTQGNPNETDGGGSGGGIRIEVGTLSGTG
ncbi:MAG: hypothetical protein AABZ62_05415, partial [Planctomycetota bacterium]